MPNKKISRHILPTLICLVLVLGLTTTGCAIIDELLDEVNEREKIELADREDAQRRFQLPREIFQTRLCTTGTSITCTDTTGENIEELPVPGGVEHATLLPTVAGGDNSSLRLGVTAAAARTAPKGAAQFAAEEPRLIFVANTTAQILNLGTTTLGAQAQLTGRIQLGIPVAVSGDGTFAAAMVRRAAAGTGGVDHSVDLIDLSSMTRTGTIELPAGCDARGMAFIPGTSEFAVSCTDDDAIRFYSLNGGAGSGLLREFTGCEGARAVVFTADGQRGLFSCTSSVWVYDVLADSVVHTIEGFDSVRAMATAMDATRAYVVNWRDNVSELIVVDLATYDIVRTTEVGRRFTVNPTVVVGPDDQRVYVLASREVRGVVVTDREGVELNFVPSPGVPFTFLIVRLPVSTDENRETLPVAGEVTHVTLIPTVP